jgi:hypothetical protein
MRIKSVLVGVILLMIVINNSHASGFWLRSQWPHGAPCPANPYPWADKEPINDCDDCWLVDDVGMRESLSRYGYSMNGMLPGGDDDDTNSVANPPDWTSFTGGDLYFKGAPCPDISHPNNGWPHWWHIGCTNGRSHYMQFWGQVVHVCEGDVVSVRYFDVCTNHTGWCGLMQFQTDHATYTNTMAGVAKDNANVMSWKICQIPVAVPYSNPVTNKSYMCPTCFTWTNFAGIPQSICLDETNLTLAWTNQIATNLPPGSALPAPIICYDCARTSAPVMGTFDDLFGDTNNVEVPSGFDGPTLYGFWPLGNSGPFNGPFGIPWSSNNTLSGPNFIQQCLQSQASGGPSGDEAATTFPQKGTWHPRTPPVGSEGKLFVYGQGQPGYSADIEVQDNGGTNWAVYVVPVGGTNQTGTNLPFGSDGLIIFQVDPTATSSRLFRLRSFYSP